FFGDGLLTSATASYEKAVIQHGYQLNSIRYITKMGGKVL
ncbi:1920_t:CDS:1, partial [Rhizophagus irregularis]